MTSAPLAEAGRAAPAGPDIKRSMIALIPDLRGFARVLLRDRSAADDLVQDTLVRALAAIGQFQEGTNLKAWMFTIQRNVFYEQARRRGRERVALGAKLNAQGEQADSAGPTQSARAEIADVQRLLWLLPARLREALVLIGAQELSYEEAALVCGVPVGTVKARVSRARAALAELASNADRPGTHVAKRAASGR